MRRSPIRLNQARVRRLGTVNEIRIREGGAFRVIYVAKFSEAVYVLHAFHKKARKTPKAEIDVARDRYRVMVSERKQR